MKKLLSLITFLILTQLVIAQEAIQYTLSLENAVHHEAFISMVIPNAPAGPLKVRMSRSSPGRYATHEFGKNVYNVHAFDADGKEIRINQIDGDVYEIPSHQTPIKITYTLFANWVDGTYAGIDYRHAHLNMPATFMWAPALQNRPMSVKFVLPQDWKVATQLKLQNGLYTAPNLQYFMDSPTEISNFKQKTWEASNADGLKQNFFIVYHGASADETLSAFETKVKKVVNEAQAVFGELPKFDNGEYRFLIDVLPTNAGDGMEHRNSTIITNRSENLEKAGENVIGTVSHEFFHAWNVERIRPKTLEPFNFEKSNMSDGLWLAEGFTQYYGELILTRAGITSPENFGTYQGALLNNVLNSPGALKYSPIFMSQRAVFVDAGVAIDQNNYANMYSSYYFYGNITAITLDLTLRNQFNLTLDDYMKALWKAHGKSEIAYKITDLEKVLADVSKSADFAKTFFSKYIYGSDKADFAKLLAPAGYVFKRTKADEAWLGGVRFTANEGKIMISSPVIKETPLYLAGLESGDIITKIDEQAIKDNQALADFLKTKKPNDLVSINFERGGENYSVNLKLANNPAIEVLSFEKEGLAITPAIEAYRKSWLGSKAIN